MQIASDSRAMDVIRLLQQEWPRPSLAKVTVADSGVPSVNQVYTERDPAIIPVGFSLTCAEMKWDPEVMWKKLSDGQSPWYEAANGSYIYWNQGDGQWWIDAPDGAGVYIVKAPNTMPPSQGWVAL